MLIQYPQLRGILTLKIKHYYITNERQLSFLQQNVNLLIKEGYQPYGYVFHDGDMLCQCMVKYEDKRENE